MPDALRHLDFADILNQPDTPPNNLSYISAGLHGHPTRLTPRCIVFLPDKLKQDAPGGVLLARYRHPVPAEAIIGISTRWY